jgi:NAD(P)-dependent dehydrogenase (short-subunit alcohol dehydrogenase family)
MRELQGKVAFITGGASGIGLGMAHAFAEAGVRVAIGDIEEAALEKARAELEAGGAEVRAIHCDVTDRASVFAAAESVRQAFGDVHVLCNNAGVSSGGLVEELDVGDWDWVIGVNYLGVLHGLQAFLPQIKSHGEGGHIVNTSSMAGMVGGGIGWGPYNSTKFAVVGLTEVLRSEGREHGFGASVLCPGAVDTQILDAARNRPSRFGPQRGPVAATDIGPDLRQGLDPRVVGELVVEAVRENRLYIFTDPRMRRLVERRFERILGDFEWAAQSQALARAGAPGARS